MIYIKKHIGEITLTFGSRKMIATLPHLHAAGQRVALEVPAEIAFNEDWTVEHQCSCRGPVTFSRTHNWNLVSRLTSRYCTYPFLESLGLVFDSLRVLESRASDITFLTTAEFDDVDAAVYRVPQVNFNHYVCGRCGSEFLCRLREGHPISPDARHQSGREGLLLIHEIVEIGHEGTSDFLAMWRKGTGHVD